MVRCPRATLPTRSSRKVGQREQRRMTVRVNNTARCDAPLPTLLASLDLLVRINAPEAALLDPSVKSIARQPAPLSVATLDRAEHSGFEHRAQGTHAVRGFV